MSVTVDGPVVFETINTIKNHNDIKRFIGQQIPNKIPRRKQRGICNLS